MIKDSTASSFWFLPLLMMRCPIADRYEIGVNAYDLFTDQPVIHSQDETDSNRFPVVLG